MPRWMIVVLMSLLVFAVGLWGYTERQCAKIWRDWSDKLVSALHQSSAREKEAILQRDRAKAELRKILDAKK